MDSFKEQIVKKVASKSDKMSKAFIMVASVALAFFCFTFAFGTRFSLFGILFAALALYGGYYLLTKLDVEYEYAFTNGDFDVDKIVAQRSRKRMISFSVSSATDFGKADENFEVKDGRTTVIASASDDEQVDYYIDIVHKDLGETTVIFTPNDDMLELIKSSLPRKLRTKI